MIDEGWFSHYGNLDFDRARFPDPKAMIGELHDLGKPVMLWVCPYISADGQFFTELILPRPNAGAQGRPPYQPCGTGTGVARFLSQGQV
ncbi:MAG: TIM-barrel domain-containing protein [Bryobacteraceae bacterium]|jgi:alpha-glucosidase (family GH31 glycosyl hydrolase)